MAELTLEQLRQRLGVTAPPPVQETPSSGLSLTIRPPGVEPVVGPENAGTPGAATLGATPSAIAVPPEINTADTRPKPSEGSADIDVIMQGVWQTESGNRQTDPKTGKIITSPTGNLGVSQLGVATAKELGVDPHDEAQNRAGGRKYLGQMFEKYGNWRDAVGAYFAGPGNYDKWLDNGSKRDSKLGKQITTYQDTVLARAGVAERAASAERAPDGSRMLGLDSMRALLNDLPPATQEETDARAKLKREREGGTFLEESTDRAKALTYGLYKGARDAMLAVPQAVMEQVYPEGAKWLTERVNEVDKPWENLRNAHSYLSGAGQIVGGVGAILGTTRLLGPPVAAGAGALGITTVMREIAPRVPWMLNSAGGLTTAGRYAASVPVGAALTAGTTFTESGDPADRLALAALGGIAGPLGVSFGQAFSKAINLASSKGQLAREMTALKANAQVLEGDLNYLKDVAVSRLGRVEQEAAKRYAAATGVGREVRGLDAETLRETVQGYTTKAASQIEQTKGRLIRELGLDKEAERAAQALVQRQQYAEHVRAVGLAQDKYIDSLAGKQYSRENLNIPQFRAQIRASLETDPAFPRVTMPEPTPHVPGVVSAEAFMKARQLLRREMSATTDRAKRGQLTGLRRELDKSFETAARDAGMNAGEFYRKLLAADRYYKSTVVPAHDVFQGWFGRQYRGASQIADDSVNKLTQGLDGTKIFAKVVETVESGTQREVDAMLHVFGTTPRDKERLVRSLAYRALTKAEGGIGKDFDPLAVRKYIDENHKNLARVLTPEQYQWMKGFAKLTESLAEGAKSVARQDSGFWRSSRILNIFGLEHFSRGEYMSGAKLMLSGLFAHTFYNNVGKLRDKLVSRIVAKMGDLTPGSAEFNRAISALEWRLARNAALGVRAVGDVSGVGAKPPPSFQPIAPMPPQ